MRSHPSGEWAIFVSMCAFWVTGILMIFYLVRFYFQSNLLWNSLWRINLIPGEYPTKSWTSWLKHIGRNTNPPTYIQNEATVRKPWFWLANLQNSITCRFVWKIKCYLCLSLKWCKKLNYNVAKRYLIGSSSRSQLTIKNIWERIKSQKSLTHY